MGIECTSGVACYRQDEQVSGRRGLGGGGSVYQWVNFLEKFGLRESQGRKRFGWWQRLLNFIKPK